MKEWQDWNDAGAHLPRRRPKATEHESSSYMEHGSWQEQQAAEDGATKSAHTSWSGWWKEGPTEPAPKRAMAVEGRFRGRTSTRLICSIHLHMLHDGFALVPIIIGRGGENTRRIAKATGSKIRVRGRGSGHKEANGREAPTPLMLAVTAEADNIEGFQDAVVQSIDLLRGVEMRYRAHCKECRFEAASETFTLVLKDARCRSVAMHLEKVLGDTLPPCS